MLSSAELQRYSRHLLLPEFGIEGQQKLKAARVLVVGCGGLGSPVLLYLAAAGIGTIGLIDNDLIDESNLQRQVLYDTSAIGKPKAEEAAKRLKALNPHLQLVAYNLQLNASNALGIIESYDLVIDGTDNFPTRYLINDACAMCKKPFVYGAIYRFEGQVSIFNYNNGPDYRDLFPTPPPPELAPNCAEAGVLGVLPGIVGTLQANEAIKLIANIGQPLTGRLFVIDALTLQTRTLKIPKRPQREPIKELIDYEEFCNVEQPTTKNIDYQTLRQWQNEGADFQLIDVREAKEYAIKNIGGGLMPLSQLDAFVDKIDRNKKVVIHCQSGKRSQQAIAYLEKKYGFDNLLNLENGMLGINDFFL